MTDATATADWFENAFAGAPLMAILRGMGVERSLQLSTTAWDLGIDSVEVPLQTDEDERALRAVVAAAAERGKSVGAGTIITPAQVDVAAHAGAAYLVSPGLDPVVVRAAQERGIPILPGVATPTEVQLAVSLGLTWLKAFPATWLGSGWFKHIRGPFPQVRFVATGGLDASNVEEFLDVGVRVAAVGSALGDASQLERLAAVLRARAPR
jgi:Entner-Doudoroff aldolase